MEVNAINYRPDNHRTSILRLYGMASKRNGEVYKRGDNQSTPEDTS